MEIAEGADTQTAEVMIVVIFGNKNKSGAVEINFSSIEGGVPGIPNGRAISATLEDEMLKISQRLGKEQPTYLPYEKIVGFEVVADAEIIEKQKSVVGRAFVGGLLLGPLAAVVGAIDGTGKKTKTNIKKYFVINYRTSSGEVAPISMEIVGATLGIEKFKKALAEKVPQTIAEPTNAAPIIL